MRKFVEEDTSNPDIMVAIDEIVSNIVRCSGATKFEFEVTAARQLVFRDDGKAFDPYELTPGQMRKLVGELVMPEEGRGISDFIGLLSKGGA